MGVIFFLFQFSQVIKEQGNNYGVNVYAEEIRANGSLEWEQPITGRMDPNLTNGDFVVYIGSTTSLTGRTVAEWCKYTKRNLISINGISWYNFEDDCQPEMIFIESGSLDYRSDSTSLMNIVGKYHVPTIFLGAPPIQTLRVRTDIRRLVGINDIITEVSNVESIHMYSGFLLGGEIIYGDIPEIDDEEMEVIQDMDLTIPWYKIGRNTKTYVVGDLGNSSGIDKADYPAIIWRNTYSDTQIYVVGGDFYEGPSALGVYSAIAYELKPYDLYPVVNARNFVLIDYPGFAYENEEVMQRIYSRSQSAVLRDIMWPGINSMSSANKLKLTCYMSPQYDYYDNIEPVSDEVVFYLQQFKEADAEAGMSMKATGNTKLEDKFREDIKFYGSLDTNYKFASLYTDDLPAELSSRLAGGELPGVSSITIPYRDGSPMVSYYNPNVTIQRINGEAEAYSYTKDFELRSLLTALGYSTVSIDIHRVLFPEGKDDQWEKYYEFVARYTSTFWNQNKAFERTAVSTSDVRVRNFLNADYTEERSGDNIYVELKNATECYFILRTHGEDVKDVSGSIDFEKLEEDVFLVKLKNGRNIISLVPAEDVKTFEEVKVIQ